MTAALLEVHDLRVSYGTGRRTKEIVHGVSFAIESGRTMGLVGESGSGKSTIGRAIAGLAPASGGTIVLDGQDVGGRSRRLDRAIAAKRQMVFQDPYSSLNPAVRVVDALLEPLRVLGWKHDAAHRRVAEVADRVGLPVDALMRYAGSFSGGQRQRIAIARALVVSPRLVICDEAVSALDLSIQAQILNLLRELQDETGVSYLFIGHNLDVMRFIAHDLIVLHDGVIVESGPAPAVIRAPRDAYTRRLVSAILSPDPAEQRVRREARLHATGSDADG